MRLKFVLVFLLQFFVIQSVVSQDKGTFRAYLNSGFTINQISGDSLGGFNYWGFSGGAGSYFMVLDKFSANLEINYTMRGASGTVFDELNNSQYHRAITANYIEVPVMVNYHDKDVARFGLGMAVSTLLKSRQWYNEKQVVNDRVENYYKNVDFSIIAAATFNIKEHFGVSLRMLHSIVPTNNDIGEESQYHINLHGKFLYYF